MVRVTAGETSPQSAFLGFHPVLTVPPVHFHIPGSAARRGDMVLTGDFEDLTKLRSVFPAVRLLQV